MILPDQEPLMPLSLGGMGGGEPTSLIGEVAQLRAQVTDMMRQIEAQTTAINSVRGSLGGISSDDIQIEKKPDGTSYWSVPGLFDPADIPLPPPQHVMGRIVSYNGGNLSYEWVEQEWTVSVGGNVSIADKENGLSSSGVGGGSEEPARHANLIPELPGSTVIALYYFLDSGLNKQWFFTVPVQTDPDFVHRTDPAASPTAGSREDLTMTTAQLNTEAASSALDWSIRNQGNKRGVVYTAPSRGIVYNGSGDAKIYGYVTDIELDVMGRVVSRSGEMRYEIHTPAAC